MKMNKELETLKAQMLENKLVGPLVKISKTLD